MSAHNHPCVAVVDDNVDDRMVMEIILQEDLGFSTHELPANTWGEDLLPVIERYVSLQLDVLLLDLKLPSLHGIQLIQMLRRLPKLEHVLVIAVTVETNPEQVDLARRCGFNGFIGKPLNIRRFPQQIRRILAGEGVWEPT
jgi:two-component system cell cycle response regulator DivK